MAHIDYIEKTEGGEPRVIIRETISSEYRAIRRIVYYILDVIELLLFVRFVMRLLGANPISSFVSFIYQVTGPLVAPFRGIFPAATVEGSVIDWSVLVAMLVYAVVAYLIIRLFRMLLK